MTVTNVELTTPPVTVKVTVPAKSVPAMAGSETNPAVATIVGANVVLPNKAETTGLTNEGLFENTALLVPVSFVKAVANASDENVPSDVLFPPEVIAPVKLAFVVTVPAVNPAAVPVIFVPINAVGVPKLGVINTGELFKTRFPVPVSSDMTADNCADVVSAKLFKVFEVVATVPIVGKVRVVGPVEVKVIEFAPAVASVDPAARVNVPVPAVIVFPLIVLFVNGSKPARVDKVPVVGKVILVAPVAVNAMLAPDNVSVLVLAIPVPPFNGAITLVPTSVARFNDPQTGEVAPPLRICVAVPAGNRAKFEEVEAYRMSPVL